MRNTTDDPTWTSFIYHDHVSWFPGGGYVVEKLFREHFAEMYLASTSGTFHDIADRASFFADISQMKPEGWQPERWTPSPRPRPTAGESWSRP